jgi:nucleotide-binding universal stress UspA family protein
MSSSSHGGERGRRDMPGIIVGTDGSSRSLGAVEWGMQEAAIRRVPVTVVIVYQAAVGYWGGRALP